MPAHGRYHHLMSRAVRKPKTEVELDRMTVDELNAHLKDLQLRASIAGTGPVAKAFKKRLRLFNVSAAHGLASNTCVLARSGRRSNKLPPCSAFDTYSSQKSLGIPVRSVPRVHSTLFQLE
jgi:hypothetical protein